MKKLYTLFLLLFVTTLSWGQTTTVYSDNFSSNTNALYTTTGQIGTSDWYVTRNTDDWGARRNTSPEQLELTNDASATANANGWVYAAVPLTSISSPFDATLGSNSHLITWSFNMRQIRTDPSGFSSSSYGAAFVLGSTSSTIGTAGNGYAVVLGGTGAVDPVRLVKFTGGIQTLGTANTSIISSVTSGLTDFGAEYLSVKVTYNPTNNQWELFVRNDGATIFTDPATGTLVSQGTAVDNTHTSTAFTTLGAYWNGSTGATQTAFFDNVLVTTSPAPIVPVCGLSLGTTTKNCDAITFGIDTYTITIPFTGGGTENFTINTTAGTVGGDNPTSVASGNITITGVSEGVNPSITITSTLCNFTVNVTDPECKPVNTLPYYEPFDYTIGQNLGAQQRWKNLNSGDEVVVTSGNLSYAGLAVPVGNSVAFAGDGKDPQSIFTTTSAGELYTSFLFNVPVNFPTGTTGAYFAVLSDALGTTHRARLFVKRNSDTDFTIGLGENSIAPTYHTDLYSTTSTILIVMGYDFTANSLKLWINPDVSTLSTATPATVTVTPSVTFANLASFVLRQDGTTVTPSIVFDELRISTTLGGVLSVGKSEISGFAVYPNPVKGGKVFISSNNNDAERTVAIFDVLGKQVVAQKGTQSSVEVSHLTKGVYIIKVTEEGKTATRKLVVE